VPEQGALQDGGSTPIHCTIFVLSLTYAGDDGEPAVATLTERF
jgi:hypothetical protein